MQKGKYTRKKSLNLKSLLIVICVILIACGIAGGTIAWLVSDTGTVVNTFTYGDIDLKLQETEVDENGAPVTDDNGSPVKTTEGNIYKMIPGEKFLKDPEVTVLKGSEGCWLFVKLEEKGGATVTNGDGSTTEYTFDDYLAYEVDEKWTALIDDKGEKVEGVYFIYQQEASYEKDSVYAVIKNNEISVRPEVDKAMLNAIDDNGKNAENAVYPSLSLKAYALQLNGFEAEVSEGAQQPSLEQLNAAAFEAWNAIEVQNASKQP